ncbi:uncharacterized protein LOC115245436 [Formica exsecta]|uniref:uncharacterized protein LOC115245436 n=1 Tax=Formica exsecta TaxID=72781 RepID=UPI001142F9FA|nr:uncharacterized protein LOC115245436 [Formica exsecta]
MSDGKPRFPAASLVCISSVDLASYAFLVGIDAEVPLKCHRVRVSSKKEPVAFHLLAEIQQLPWEAERVRNGGLFSRKKRVEIFLDKEKYQYDRNTRPVPARTCHRIPVKRHRQWEKNKLPESDDQLPWRQSPEPSITRDLASSTLLSERSAHSLPVPVSLAYGSPPSGRRVALEAMHRAEEKTIARQLALGSDKRTEPPPSSRLKRGGSSSKRHARCYF